MTLIYEYIRFYSIKFKSKSIFILTLNSTTSDTTSRLNVDWHSRIQTVLVFEDSIL